MATLYRTRALDLATEEETYLEGETYSESQAMSSAEKWAETFYGGDDVTWLSKTWGLTYEVGRIDEDGNREPVSCIISVEEYEEDEDDA